jgi:isochorismate synthase
VNIRCLRSAGNRAVLYVGAGITAGSDPRQEWIETEQKAQTWLKPIAALRS